MIMMMMIFVDMITFQPILVYLKRILTTNLFCIPIWNWQSVNSFTQNGNNDVTLTSIINFSQFSPPCENGDQLLENEEENKPVVISRLRIGYTRLTHTFILKQEPQPQCLTCQTTCTVKHILIECRAFAVIKKRFFKESSLTESL